MSSLDSQFLPGENLKCSLPSPELTGMSSEGKANMPALGRQTDSQGPWAGAEKGRTSWKGCPAASQVPREASSAPSDVSPSGTKKTLSWESPSAWSRRTGGESRWDLGRRSGLGVRAAEPPRPSLSSPSPGPLTQPGCFPRPGVHPPPPPPTPADPELRSRLDRSGHRKLRGRPGTASCFNIWTTT